MHQQVTDTFTASILMAGDIATAKQVCREFCFEHGLCVTVEPVAYIYTGGEEAGFRVGLINYPRFPSMPSVLRATADSLALALMTRLCQHSYTILTPQETRWVSRRAP